MLAELSRREFEANIKPDPNIDTFMKVIYMIKLKNNEFIVFLGCLIEDVSDSNLHREFISRLLRQKVKKKV